MSSQKCDSACSATDIFASNAADVPGSENVQKESTADDTYATFSVASPIARTHSWSVGYAGNSIVRVTRTAVSVSAPPSAPGDSPPGASLTNTAVLFSPSGSRSGKLHSRQSTPARSMFGRFMM